MTPADIEKALSVCASGDAERCPECPYHLNGCEIVLTKDTLAYIEVLKRSERFFAESCYDVKELGCKYCIHKKECDEVLNWDKDEVTEIPREKCIAGMIAFARKYCCNQAISHLQAALEV